MPSANRFRHQEYTDAPPQSDYHLIQADKGPAADSEEFASRMQAVGDRFRELGISTIYLVHGTFVGGDAAGWWAGLARYVPGIAETLRQISKKWIDAAVGDHGNYTEEFRKLFEESINRDGTSRIDVRLFYWTSENHHLGRADAAIRLLDEIQQRESMDGILFWGHSHAGNVFALLSSLMACDLDSIDAFFQASRSTFCNPFTGKTNIAVWQRVWDQLRNRSTLTSKPRIRFVTFGTPIRYGWDTDRCSSLLHFINHKPIKGIPEYLAAFPLSFDEVSTAANGDYVQQIGIAGTNVSPGIFLWRRWLADRRLNRFLQPDLRVRDVYHRLKLAMRVPADGTTLLVDYGPATGGLTEHLAGHAVYTEADWLLFHAEKTAEYL